MFKKYKEITKEFEEAERVLKNLETLDKARNTHEVANRRFLPYKDYNVYEGYFELDKDITVKLTETKGDYSRKDLVIRIINIKKGTILKLPTINKDSYKDFFILYKLYPEEMEYVYTVLSAVGTKNI